MKIEWHGPPPPRDIADSFPRYVRWKPKVIALRADDILDVDVRLSVQNWQFSYDPSTRVYYITFLEPVQ